MRGATGLVGLLGLLLCASSACGTEAPTQGLDAGGVETGGPRPIPFPADCVGCRKDGQSCRFSINCQSGEICNGPNETGWDSTRPNETCVRIVCQGDDDCSGGRVCTLRGLCEPPVCQIDTDCANGQRCRDGACISGG